MVPNAGFRNVVSGPIRPSLVVTTVRASPAAVFVNVTSAPGSPPPADRSCAIARNAPAPKGQKGAWEPERMQARTGALDPPIRETRESCAREARDSSTLPQQYDGVNAPPAAPEGAIKSATRFLPRIRARDGQITSQKSRFVDLQPTEAKGLPDGKVFEISASHFQKLISFTNENARP